MASPIAYMNFLPFFPSTVDLVGGSGGSPDANSYGGDGAHYSLRLSLLLGNSFEFYISTGGAGQGSVGGVMVGPGAGLDGGTSGYCGGGGGAAEFGLYNSLNGSATPLVIAGGGGGGTLCSTMYSFGGNGGANGGGSSHGGDYSGNSAWVPGQGATCTAAGSDGTTVDATSSLATNGNGGGGGWYKGGSSLWAGGVRAPLAMMLPSPHPSLT